MTLEKFKLLLQNNNGVPVDNRYIIFNDFSIYDLKTDEMKRNDSLESLLDDTIGDKKVKEIVESSEEFYQFE